MARRERWVEAGQLYERATILAPGRDDLIKQAADCFLKGRDPRHAGDLYRTLPNASVRGRALFDVGEACWQHQDFDEAVTFFEMAVMAVKDQGRDGPLAAWTARFLALASEQRDREQWARAATLFELLWRVDPTLDHHAISAGECRARAGQFERAIEIYRLVDGGAGRPETLLRIGDAHARMDAIDAAVSSFETALSCPAFDALGDRSAWIARIRELGLAQRGRGHWPASTRLFDLLVRLDPGQADLLIEAGHCRRDAGDLAGAIAWYDRVTDVAWRSKALFEKGNALIQAGDVLPSLQAFHMAGLAGSPAARERAIACGLTLSTKAEERRHQGAWLEAAEIYEFLFRHVPDQGGAALKSAICFRKAGAFQRAIGVYQITPDDSGWGEIAFQRAETLVEAEDFEGAIAFFEKAAADDHPLAPKRLYETIKLWSATPGAAYTPRHQGERSLTLDTPVSEHELLNRLTAKSTLRHLLGSLDHSTHRAATEEGFDENARIKFDQIGWTTVTNDAKIEPLLMGVVAVRGRILSDHRLVRVDVSAKADIVATDTPSLVRRHSSGKWLYAFNLWVDADRIGPCRTSLCVWASSPKGAVLRASKMVNVVRTAASFDLSVSDSYVPSPVDHNDVTADVLARSPLVRSAKRVAFPEAIREIVAMRVDQLGDLSTTLPAIRRLRELFPHARITGLVSSALSSVLEATALCDDVLGLNLGYDHVSERRFLDDAERGRLTDLVEKHRFDIAIDLCPGDETRALLKLLDAKYLVGFNPREFKYLDFGVDVLTRDKVNQSGIVSHTASVTILVESLGTIMRPAGPPIHRVRDDTALLARYGLVSKEYIVIHSGARHAINCWPLANYLALARRLTETTDHKIVFFSDEDLDRRSDDRILFAGKMPIDHFDAIFASADMMVGNDSGPKHLAAVHGVKTVSIHINRLNWREWGQEGDGIIISKRVPCCGCGLNNLAMCAKNAACITTIGVDEVFEAINEHVRLGPVSAGGDHRPRI